MHRNPAANEYMRTKILTASPQELRLLLYDGAIKFAGKARQAVEDEDIEESYNCLMRAQKIVLELSTSLNHDVDRELCQKLSALYNYIYRLLVDANLHKTAKPLDEALHLLEYEKQTWQLLMKKTAANNGSSDTGGQMNLAGAQQTAINSFSVNG